MGVLLVVCANGYDSVGALVEFAGIEGVEDARDPVSAVDYRLDIVGLRKRGSTSTPLLYPDVERLSRHPPFRYFLAAGEWWRLALLQTGSPPDRRATSSALKRRIGRPATVAFAAAAAADPLSCTRITAPGGGITMDVNA